VPHASAESRRPILVTGAHRSGTTWAGEVMATAPGVEYVHEPFSVTDAPSPGVSAVRFRHWFAYICRENEGPYLAPLRRTVALRWDHVAATRWALAQGGVRRLAHDWSAHRRSRGRATRVLLKDPIAFFSAPWLAERLGMDIVVLIRHPAAFVSSIVQLGWTHPFAHFLEQPLLMRDVLSPWESEIRDFAARERPILEQGILLWRMIYATAERYRREHADWWFARHEDLSREPEARFRELFVHLGLPIAPDFEARIAEFCGPANRAQPGDDTGSPYAVRRDSAKNLDSWKRRLGADEIRRIREGTADVAHHFYGDADW
jgi:hypothetical protein